MFKNLYIVSKDQNSSFPLIVPLIMSGRTLEKDVIKHQIRCKKKNYERQPFPSFLLILYKKYIYFNLKLLTQYQVFQPANHHYASEVVCFLFSASNTYSSTSSLEVLAE